MSEIIDQIVDKIGEYGIEVFDQFPTDEDTQFIIMSEDMVLTYDFLNKVLGVSFHVGTKPDDAARYILILKEIKKIKKYSIMESFIFNEESNFIDGEEAYEIFEENRIKEIIDSFVKDQTQKYMLATSKGFRC